MKLAITGARGFIAGHVVAAAAAEGHELLVWDGRGCGAASGSHARIDLPYDSPLAPGLLGGADAVIHLAGRYPRFGEPELPAMELQRVNAGLTATVLGACLAAGVPRVVLASTASVYVRSSLVPLAESAAVDARGAYAASKLEAESLLQAASVAGDVHGISLRLFNVYGPGQPACAIVPTIALPALAGEPVCVHDDRPVRDFVYAADAARALVAAATRPGVSPGIINIGSGRGTSVRQLGRCIMAAAGRSDDVQARSGHAAASRDAVVADIALARRELQWEPLIGLAEGIAATLAALRGTRSAA